MSDVTQILNQIERGDSGAAERLLPLVDDELRKLAAAKLRQEKPGQSLQATALVHEAYLRLVDVQRIQRWDSRGHFFSAAAEAMRRLLVEQYRRKQRIKRGGDLQQVPLGEIVAERADENLVQLDQALTELAGEDALAAKMVELRYFAGLGHEQIAQQNTAAPRTFVQTAQAYYRVALLQTGLGDTDSAETAYRAAIERFEKMTIERPDDWVGFRGLGQARNGCLYLSGLE